MRVLYLCNSEHNIFQFNLFARCVIHLLFLYWYLHNICKLNHADNFKSRYINKCTVTLANTVLNLFTIKTPTRRDATIRLLYCIIRKRRNTYVGYLLYLLSYSLLQFSELLQISKFHDLGLVFWLIVYISGAQPF